MQDRLRVTVVATGIGKRAANTLGFKGTEDLGNGLKALFQLEMRYEPDTGLNETNGAGVQRPDREDKAQPQTEDLKRRCRDGDRLASAR